MSEFLATEAIRADNRDQNQSGSSLGYLIQELMSEEMDVDDVVREEVEGKNEERSTEMKAEEINHSDDPARKEVLDELTKELLAAKLQIAILRKEKRGLLEELHRQFLEGEVDPKKRIKPYFEKRKKMGKAAAAAST